MNIHPVSDVIVILASRTLASKAFWEFERHVRGIKGKLSLQASVAPAQIDFLFVWISKVSKYGRAAATTRWAFTSLPALAGGDRSISAFPGLSNEDVSSYQTVHTRRRKTLYHWSLLCIYGERAPCPVCLFWASQQNPIHLWTWISAHVSGPSWREVRGKKEMIWQKLIKVLPPLVCSSSGLPRGVE